MPIVTTHDTARGITIHTAAGPLTFREVIGTLEGFYGRDDLPDRVLWDGRDATIAHLTHDELERIATYPKRWRRPDKPLPGGKRAIVVSTDLDYGLARIVDLVQGLARDELPYEVRTFRSLDEALHWLASD